MRKFFTWKCGNCVRFQVACKHGGSLAALHKDLWIYGQNTQIAKYIIGGLKSPYSFTDIQYFLDIFYEIQPKSKIYQKIQKRKGVLSVPSISSKDKHA